VSRKTVSTLAAPVLLTETAIASVTTCPTGTRTYVR
jgi:hypothetical protein